MKEREELVSYFARQKHEEKMSLGDIRKQLKKKSISEEEQKQLMLEIDNKSLQLLKEEKGKMQTQYMQIAGYILMFVAAILCILVFLKVIIVTSYPFLLLFFVPLVIGYALIFTARKKKRSEIKETEV